MKTYGRVNLPFTDIASCGKMLGFDLVEINPFLGSVGSTQSATVMIILEFLGAIFKK